MTGRVSPEKHLAAILYEYSRVGGNIISPDLEQALRTAEADFDGPEASEIDVSHFDEGIWKRGDPAEYFDIDRNKVVFLREITPMDDVVDG